MCLYEGNIDGVWAGLSIVFLGIVVSEVRRYRERK
jgi:hypothetical protein